MRIKEERKNGKLFTLDSANMLYRVRVYKDGVNILYKGFRSYEPAEEFFNKYLRED